MNRRTKSALLLWNIAKHSIETSSRRCYCSIVSKRGTHLVHSFLMSKFSVNMRWTTFFEMPTMSASSCTFNRRSSNNILWIFYIICVVVTSFGRSLRYPWYCFEWPESESAWDFLDHIHLNRACGQYFAKTVGFDLVKVHKSVRKRNNRLGKLWLVFFGMGNGRLF